MNEHSLQSSGWSFWDSLLEAISPGNLLWRLVSLIIFGFFLALKNLIGYIDAWGNSNTGLIGLFWALYHAQRDGVSIALGSVWKVFSAPSAYIQSNWWGSIIFSVLSMLALIAFVYQPVSLFFNIFDGRRGQATGKGIRIFASVILVIILSGVVFHNVKGETFTSDLVGVNDTQNDNSSQTGTGDSVVNSDISFETDTGESVIHLL